MSELRISRIPKPFLGKTKSVVIQIKAAAANFFDILQVQGKYQTQPPFPWCAGIEFAGIIIECTSDSGFKIGDFVFGGFQGAYAEYISIDLRKAPIYRIPQGMTFEEASTLYLTAPTCYLALYSRGNITKEDIVLIHAGAGGVGTMAIQMAKAAGAFVIATASSSEKLNLCKSLGADVAINYADGDWIDQVKSSTGGKGCSLVFDPVGLIDQSLKIVSFNARILVVGFAAGSIEKIAANKLLLKSCSLIGVYWGGTAINRPKIGYQVWEAINQLLSAGKIHAVVYKKVYNGLEQVPCALEDIGARRTWGKVVIKINSSEYKL